ncbi:MAG TPA: PQQ-binding-like beta-propeller repeat protein, partial [Planctomycetota bacterium]|nr:PQQ-binding-like beta-propeller repeat protein [Planctomycetota bacterium]
NSSDSLAGPSERLQWIDGPIWLTGANVTELFADGRSFNVMRDLRGQWTRLVARDAYNGLELWQREIQVGAASCNPRTILAVGRRVFVVLKRDDPLVALDAATGEVTETYDVGFSPLSVIHHDGHLVIAGEKEICSVDADSGKVRWRKKAPGDGIFVLRHLGPVPLVLYKPPYLVSGAGRLFVFVKDTPQPPYSLVSYDLVSGQEQWRTRQPGEILAYYKDVLLLYEVHSTTKPEKKNPDERGTYHVVSAGDGRKLWDRPHRRGDYHGVWDDPAYGGGLIWINEGSTGAKGYRGFDPVTGELKRTIKGSPPRGHCARVVASERYILGTMSVFFSLETGKRFDPGFYKNGCVVGHLPANGLVYTFPISCSCIAYLRGFAAFAPAPAAGPAGTVTEEVDPLEKGPAYGLGPQPAAADMKPAWNTYRHDVRRSGSTDEALPSDLKVLWSTSVTDSERTPHGRTVTPPVVAEGMVFVAAPDTQQVAALDATTGEVRWRYLTGGRVEAPPTIHRGLCLFGANDGWVYCLRSADGELVWRFRTAPEERRVVAYSRVESPWPVPGVLVTGGTAYFAGGRHGRTADGILVYAADPFTGKLLWRNRVDNSKLETWYDNHVNDLLVANDKAVFMDQLMFDLVGGEKSRTWYKKLTFGTKRWKHDYLLCGQGRDTTAVFPFGFLHDRKDGSQLQRYEATHWYYRGAVGLLLAFTDDRVYGIAATRQMRGNSELFARGFEGEDGPAKDPALWSVTVPRDSILALLPAGPVLFAAGPGEKGGALRAYSAADGSRLSELEFDDVPVFDGLTAASGRLYVSTRQGKVFCFDRK